MAVTMAVTNKSMMMGVSSLIIAALTYTDTLSVVLML